MRWLFKSVLVLLRSVLTLLVWLMANFVRLLLRCVLATLRFLIDLVASSLYATVPGLRRYIQWLASKWHQIILESGSSLIFIGPALIVILEDGTWMEVMSWYE